MPMGITSALSIERERTDGVKRGSIPEVSFDALTFATEERGIQKQSQRKQYVG